MSYHRGRPWLIVRGVGAALLATTALAGAASHRAVADTLEGSLALAYQNNPQLNSARAATRVTDEGVGVALSGYRPKVTGSAQLGEQYLDSLSKPSSGIGYSKSTGTIATATYSLTTQQVLFNGFINASKT